MNTLIQLKKTTPLLFAAFTLLCFAFSPAAQAAKPSPTPTPTPTAPPTEDRGNHNSAAEGVNALNLGTTGANNTAQGWFSLAGNTTGNDNTATGLNALFNNTEGTGNTANGYQALNNNTTGNYNTAVGWRALPSLTEGNFNTAIGKESLGANSTGNFNIAVGYRAGFNLTSGDNNIDIGNLGVADETNTIRIGTNGTQAATFIAGINGATVSVGTAVFIDVNGQLGTLTSSARFKDNIKPMDNASDVLFSLKPVSFRYTKTIDPAGKPQFGLVAEDVEKVNPDLVVRDKDGKPYTVRYEAVNAMLLNEFLKEHRTVQEQQKEIDALKAELKEQKVLIQKVSDKLELNKPAPQMAVNNQ